MLLLVISSCSFSALYIEIMAYRINFFDQCQDIFFHGQPLLQNFIFQEIPADIGSLSGHGVDSSARQPSQGSKGCSDRRITI